MEPLISIITPAYNAERFIAQTIESVLSQTYRNWELLIVVDSKSNDATLEIARRYQLKDPRIKVISTPDAQGPSKNRNLAINSSRGDYLAFLDADDLWLENKLELQLNFMKAKKFSFCFHSYQTITEDGTPTGRTIRAKSSTNYHQLAKNNSIGCLTVMLEKTLLGDLRFQEVPHEDFCLWLDILKRHPEAHGLPEDIARYRIVKGSRSNNKFLAALSRWSILRKREKLNFTSSCFYFMSYAASSIAKRF